jgi:hypothetical protein
MKMPTFSDDRITFIHIPKTAGASITVWYLKNINENLSNIYDHYFLTEIETSAPLKFTVIRNPWDRVVSIYIYIKTFNKGTNELSFIDFVMNKITKFKFGKHKLSTPQIRWIEPDVTHLLRFENLEEDFKIIQDIFKCYEPLPLTNVTEHDHYRTYYTEETRQVVAEMFKEDIEAFGYEF